MSNRMWLCASISPGAMTPSIVTRATPAACGSASQTFPGSAHPIVPSGSVSTWPSNGPLSPMTVPSSRIPFDGSPVTVDVSGSTGASVPASSSGTTGVVEAGFV